MNDRFDPTMYTEIVSGKEMIQSIKFDYTEEDLPTYWDIFNTYRNFENVLFVKNKIETTPIQKTEQDKWDKKQIILTLLSKVSDNKEYLNEVHNQNKIDYLQRFIDQALQEDKGVVLSSTNVLKKIGKMAEKEQIVMLNESHWMPKHRIAAARLLKPLKNAGYKYLAVEAVKEDRDVFINKHGVPLFTSGYYTSEPYFGLFIRAAKKLGFTIVSYDRFDTENREITQAENILKILDDDPEAKIFVYAGLAHINEKTVYTKRIAEYLKEISGIDPLTINQELLEGVTNEDMILFDAQSFPEDERINKTVDYFLLNNIQPDLKEFFHETPFTDYSLKIPQLKKYKNEDVFVSIFLFDEYDKYKKNAVSIKNIIYKVNDNYIRLNLPAGTYQLEIQDIENKLVYDKKIEVSIK